MRNDWGVNVVETFAVTVGERERRFHVARVEYLIIIVFSRVTNKANENRLTIVIHRVTVRKNVFFSEIELENLIGDRE